MRSFAARSAFRLRCRGRGSRSGYFGCWKRRDLERLHLSERRRLAANHFRECNLVLPRRDGLCVKSSRPAAAPALRRSGGLFAIQLCVVVGLRFFLFFLLSRLFALLCRLAFDRATAAAPGGTFLIAEVPIDSMQSRSRRPIQSTNGFVLRVRNRERDFHILREILTQIIG